MTAHKVTEALEEKAINVNDVNNLTLASALAEIAVLRDEVDSLKADKKALLAGVATARYLQQQCDIDLRALHEAPLRASE